MILVTGGTGLIGSHLLLQLCLNGEKIRALKRKSSSVEFVKKLFEMYQPEKQNLFSEIEWIDGDITDFTSLEIVFQGITKVYHCAAIVSFNPRTRKEMLQNNIQGTANIVNLCLSSKIEKLCHVSSIAAFGSENDELIDENTIRNTTLKYSSYSDSKYLSELEVWRGIAEGLHAVIVNPSVVLGLSNENHSVSSIFSRVSKGFPFYPPGINAFVDVFDVVNSMITLMNSSITGERFCVSSENLSYESVFKMISDNYQLKTKFFPIPKFIFLLAVIFESLKSKLLGITPFVSIDTYRTSYSCSQYSNKKIIEKTGISFIPIHETIRNLSKL